MAGSVKVELFEGTNTRNNTRVTLLKREDRPDVVVAFGAVTPDEVRGLFERAESSRELCPWSFYETTAEEFTDLTKLGEYTLNIKDK